MQTTTHNLDQLRRLSSLALLQAKPAPNALNFLNQLLDICRSDWIADFLFSHEPIHIPCLTSSNLSKSALTCDASTTRAEAPSLQPDPNSLYGERQHLNSRYLFAPAFTADRMTFGFGVMDGSEQRGTPSIPGDFDHSQTHLYNFRFLWNASNRTMLMVNDAPEHDCIAIYYARDISTTMGHSFMARFRRSVLLESLRRENGCLNMEKILPALVFILEEDQYRSCSQCKSTHSEECACIMPVAKPANPFDSDHFKTGFLQNFGEFQGFANKISCKNGHQVKHSVFGVRGMRRRIIDLPLVHRLSNWSVTKHLRSRPGDPRQHLFVQGYPAVASSQGLPVSPEQCMPSQGNVVFVASNRNGSTNACDDALTELTAGYPNNQRTNNQEFRLAPPADPYGYFANETMSSNGCWESFGLVAATSSNPASSVHVSPCTPSSVQPCTPSSVQPCTPNSVQVSHSMAEEVDMIRDCEWDFAKMFKGSGIEASLRPRTRRRRTAQAGKSACDIIADITKIGKDAKRKRDNRRSAAICNSRNRRNRLRVQMELNEMKDKAEYLRKKEMNLRQENLAMKRVLNKF